VCGCTIGWFAIYSVGSTHDNRVLMMNNISEWIFAIAAICGGCAAVYVKNVKARVILIALGTIVFLDPLNFQENNLYSAGLFVFVFIATASRNRKA
jgi:hypothetical protein